MKIRGALSPAARRLIGAVSVITLMALWLLLTWPFIPVAPDSAAPESLIETPADPKELANPMANAAGEALDVLVVEEEAPAEGFKPDEGNFDLYKRAAAQRATHRAIIPASILPSPSSVWKAVVYLHKEQGLVLSAWGSFKRITIAFFYAALVAIPLGIFMGTFPPVKAWFEPLTGPLRYLPISAVTGIFIVTFGVGESMKIAFLFLGTVVYLLPIVVECIENVDDVFLETAYTLGAKPWHAVLYVLMPAAWPGIFEACRVIYGIGWTYVILAELINVDYGLGYLIQLSYKRGNIDQAYAMVFIILLLGVGTNELFRFAGKRLFAWRNA